MINLRMIATSIFASALATALCGEAFGQRPADAQVPPAKTAKDKSEAATAGAVKQSDGAPDRYSPKAMRRRPSLKATGRVGEASLSPNHTSIRPGHMGEKAENAAPPPPAPRQSRGPTPPTADVAAVNEVKWNELSAALLDCRIERARVLGVTPPEVVVTSLHLTWTVKPDGSASNVRVVPAARTDRKLVTCVRKLIRYSRWIGMAARPFSMEKDLAFQ